MSFSELVFDAQKENKPWWKTVKTFFESQSLAKHQIDSYNVFLKETLSKIITKSEIHYERDGFMKHINFDNVCIHKPQTNMYNGVVKKLYPYDCRMSSSSYECRITIDILFKTISDTNSVVDFQKYENIDIGNIPCMIGSDFCNLVGKTKDQLVKLKEAPDDPFGYFIITGGERVVLSQDRLAHNNIFLFRGKTRNAISQLDYSDKKFNTPCAWYVEIRSHSDHVEPNITTTTIKITKEQLDKCDSSRIFVELTGIMSVIPLPVLFACLGVTSKEEIIRLVTFDTQDPEMVAVLENSLLRNELTQEEAEKHVGQFLMRDITIERLLKEKLLQNIPMNIKKYYIGYMVNKLLMGYLERIKEDDRDCYPNKRVDCTGGLLNNLFKSLWKKIVSDNTQNLVKKRATDPSRIFNGKITKTLHKAFAKGAWSVINVNKASRNGITQIHNRQNYIASLSDLRRVVTPSDTNSKIVKPRHLHASHWGIICPVETPEGPTTGLVKNMALFTYMSLGVESDVVYNWIVAKKISLELLSTNPSIKNKIKVFLNGTWFAVTDNAAQTVEQLREIKKDVFEISVAMTVNSIVINSDEGRLMAPFFVIRDGKLPDIPDNSTWDNLIENNVVQYLDPSEIETVKMADEPWNISPNDEYSLIHPSTFLGISANTPPFPQNNQSPRNIYQAAMGKQSIGIFCRNFMYKYDTTNYILCYPQKPIVDTNIMRFTSAQENPSGQNLKVAIMCHDYNQEDSVVLSRMALDNGCLRIMCYNSYSETEKNKDNILEEFTFPNHEERKSLIKKGGYSKLDSDGLVKENTPIEKREIIIGKTMKHSGQVKDVSITVGPNGMEENTVILDDNVYHVEKGSCIIDRTALTLNLDMKKTVKVRTRQMKPCIVGDKVASRSAQKGICGLILNPEDLPFSEEDGSVPDLIMNPNALPSRMTIAQILESLLGEACVMNGSYGDCTAFGDGNEIDKVEEIGKVLEKYGLNKYGNKVFINGKTGERIESMIYSGIVTYQRLKHMVDNKIHCRDHDGPRETLTRQPVEGRKNNGGFKMGEMETWCGISHGASSFLIDRLRNNSDKYDVYVCDYCGNIASANLEAKVFKCLLCKQNVAISRIQIPYAFKLLVQYQQACGIGVWFDV